jgi:hypothetical protein
VHGLIASITAKHSFARLLRCENKPHQPDRMSIDELMKAVAIKKGQTRERAPAFEEMGTFRCDGCGEEFIVFHHPAFVDKAMAARQAYWLEKVLAEEHERDRKHPDRIQLPD